VPREKARRRRENYEESERPKIDREFGLITLLKKKDATLVRIIKGLFDPVLVLFNYHNR